MVIELWVVQFWSEIILVISNRTRAARSFNFEITRMTSVQIATTTTTTTTTILYLTTLHLGAKKHRQLHSTQCNCHYELDDTKSCYQLIIKITVSEKKKNNQVTKKGENSY